MIILRGVPFPLPAGKRIETAPLAGKNRTLFSNYYIFKRVNFYDFHAI